MKYRDIQSGIIYASLIDARDAYCRRNSIPCSLCKLSMYNNGKDIPCNAFLVDYPELAAEMLGLEINKDKTGREIKVKVKPERGSINKAEIYRRALSTYGPEAQTLMMYEEMAELQKELCKFARGKDNKEAIAEEIADVLIMLEQMTELHNCKMLVEKYRRQKLRRLKERLEAEE